MTASTQSSAGSVAVITGGSSGLGMFIAKRFLSAGYRVVIVGRDPTRLEQAEQTLAMEAVGGIVRSVRADVTSRNDADKIVATTVEQFGRIDVWINCVGTSDRGLAADLATDRLEDLFRQNVLATLICSQAALVELRKTAGVIVNIGSLASKVGARYIGGYATVKHALAGLTQQMRLELRPDGVHVGIVCPGPIRRDDSGTRYQSAVNDKLPKHAAQPGGGARVRGLDPNDVADAVLRCAEKRIPELILPRYMRALIAVGNASPRLGDWLLLKFTSRN